MWIDDSLYTRIKTLKKRLDSLRPLDRLQLKKLREQMDVEYAYNSTSMEGNTLTLNETRLVLEEGMTISGKPLREHLDVINQRDALVWIEEQVRHKKIGLADILQLHRLTLKGISDYWAGRYKESQNRIMGSKHKTTPPYKVDSEMKNFAHELNIKGLNDVELAVFAHHELVRIHPFVDGNGRTARLLMNMTLIRRGYPPIIIQNSERKKYFDALERAHFGDMKPFAHFIARCVERALVLMLNALVPTTEVNELVPLAELAQKTRYSQEYLSLRARQGKLMAVKIDGVWHSSMQYLNDYEGS